MRREQDRDVVLARHPVQQGHDLLHALRIEVGERFVQQQELGLAHQRVRDEHPLLLPAREAADPVVGEALGVDVVEDLLDELELARRTAGEAVAVRVEAERDEVPGPHRDIGIDDDALGHVTHRTVSR